MARYALVLAAAAVVAVVLAVADAKPQSKLDAVDVDAVLKNKRLFDNYVKCIMDRAPCSAEGAELKKRLPKDLETKCAACTESEKSRAKKVINHIKMERKDVWEDFKNKYDPEHKWGDLEWVSTA